MRSSILAALLTVTAVVLATPACGDSDSSGTGTVAGSSATVDDFIASFSNLVCTAIGPCCAKAGYDDSGQQCRLLYGSLDRSKIDAAAYDPQKGRECLDKLKAATDTGVCGDSGIDINTDPVCKAALPVKGGGKKAGELCDDDDECAAVEGAEVDCYHHTEFLEGGGTKQTAYCRIERPGKAGDAPCVWTVDGNLKSYSGSSKGDVYEGFTCNVADGVYCDSTAGCKAFIADGASCSGGQCGKASYCKEGSCAPREAVGSACTGFDSCAEGAYCDNASQQCKAKLAEGAPCTSSEQCDGSCTNGACKKGGGLEDLGYGLLCGSKK